MAELKHFKKEEFFCDGVNCFDKMNTELLMMLDEARIIADCPFKISSSWRSEEHNANVGGKPNSSHLRGKAVDIVCTSSHQRLRILDGLLMAGFTRIGIAKTFIHADCDITLPQDVLWLY